MSKEHKGQTVIHGTTYQVYQLPTGENSHKAGIIGHWALEGPRGACYFVTDYGPSYQLNSVAVGGSQTQHWTPAARPLRGLTREHLRLFLEAQQTCATA